MAVKCIAAYCAIAYTLIVTLLLGYWCSPIYEYWRVPVAFRKSAVEALARRRVSWERDFETCNG